MTTNHPPPARRNSHPTLKDGPNSDENLQLIQMLADEPVNERNFVTDEIRTSIFRKLRMRQENRTCFDCPARNPTWISLSHGNYVCLVCRCQMQCEIVSQFMQNNHINSGEHRRMGTHISFVRSVELDSFTKEQLVQMIVGGNGKIRQFFKSVGIEAKRKENVTGQRSVDYYDKNSVKYRRILEKETADACQIIGVHKELRKSGSAVSDDGKGLLPSPQQQQQGQQVQDAFNQAFSAAPSGAGFSQQSSNQQAQGGGAKGKDIYDDLFAGMMNQGSGSASNSQQQNQTSSFGTTTSNQTQPQQQQFQNTGFGVTPAAQPAKTPNQLNPFQPQGFGSTTISASVGNSPANAPSSNQSQFGAGGGSAPSVIPQASNINSFNTSNTGGGGGAVHFAASSAPKKPANVKAKVLDDDFDFDFGSFETEANRKLADHELAENQPTAFANGPGFGQTAANNNPVQQQTKVVGTYGLPTLGTTPAPATSSTNNPNPNYNNESNTNANGTGAANANPFTTTNNNPNTSPKDFGDKKAFGSQDFFPEDDDVFNDGDANRFNGANAISSDAYFGKEMTASKSDELKLKTKIAMEKGKEMARQGTQKLKNFAADYLQRPSQ